MKKIQSFKKYSIGFILGISIAIGTTYAANNGSIGALFQYLSGTENGVAVTNVWRLEGENIKDGTVTSYEIKDGTIDYTDVNTTIQQIVTGTCGVNSSIRVINSDGSVICESDTDTQLSEITVENYIANDTSINYVVKDVGGKLGDSSIYDDGITVSMTGKKITNVGYPNLITDAATVGYVNNNGVPSGAVMAFSLAACPAGWSAYGAANGRTIIGIGNSGAAYSTNHGYGSSGGEEKHKLTVSELASHSHTYYTGNSASFGAGYDAKTEKLFNKIVSSGSAGGNQAHSNMQPYITLRYCKKN